MATPKIVPGAALGTGGTASITGVDQCGILSVTTGAAPPVGAGQPIFELHFSGLYTNGSDWALYPLDSATETLDYLFSGIAANPSELFPTLPAGLTLAANTTYNWAYQSRLRLGIAT